MRFVPLGRWSSPSFSVLIRFYVLGSWLVNSPFVDGLEGDLQWFKQQRRDRWSCATMQAERGIVKSFFLLLRKKFTENEMRKWCRTKCYFYAPTGFIDARQRSGSMAAGTVSAVLQGDQQVQRSMSFSVPMLTSGTRQFNVKGNIFRQRKDFSAFQVGFFCNFDGWLLSREW